MASPSWRAPAVAACLLAAATAPRSCSGPKSAGAPRPTSTSRLGVWPNRSMDRHSPGLPLKRRCSSRSATPVPKRSINNWRVEVPASPLNRPTARLSPLQLVRLSAVQRMSAAITAVQLAAMVERSVDVGGEGGGPAGAGFLVEGRQPVADQGLLQHPPRAHRCGCITPEADAQLTG